MADALIDLWDPGSFDPELRAALDAQADLVAAFVSEAELIDAEYEADRRAMVRRSNPHYDAMEALEHRLDPLLRRRVGRAWHYTRLTDDEVDRIRAEGMSLASIPAFQARMAHQVAVGRLSQDQADGLFASSALCGDHHDHRAQQICTTAIPFPITDGGIANLLGLWGGETASFHLQDPDLRAHLATIGRPRVLELAVPLASVRPSTGLGRAAIAAYAHKAGVAWDPSLPDLFLIEPLGPDAVVAVLTQGDPSFDALGVTLPAALPGTLAERIIRGY